MRLPTLYFKRKKLENGWWLVYIDDCVPVEIVAFMRKKHAKKFVKRYNKKVKKKLKKWIKDMNPLPYLFFVESKNKRLVSLTESVL